MKACLRIFLLTLISILYLALGKQNIVGYIAYKPVASHLILQKDQVSQTCYRVGHTFKQEQAFLKEADERIEESSNFSPNDHFYREVYFILNELYPTILEVCKLQQTTAAPILVNTPKYILHHNLRIPFC